MDINKLRSDVRDVLDRIQELQLPKLPKSNVSFDLHLDDTFEGLENRLENIAIFERLQNLTGLPKYLIAIAGTSFAVVFTVLSFYVTFLGLFTSRLIGFAYPVYASFKAIESPETDDDTQWLTYWVVFSFFSVFEMVALGIFNRNSAVGAGYFLAKVLFLAWCQFGKGAYYLYNLFVRPFVLAANKIEGQLDKWSEAYVEKRMKVHQD